MGAVKRVASVAVAAALLVAACSDSSDRRPETAAAVNEAQRGGGGWGTLAIQANFVEQYDTLSEMAMKADVVVIAQATGVDGVRQTGSEEGLGGNALAQVRFRVIRAVSDWDADAIVVEFDEVMSLKALEEQVAGFPPAVLLLREKGLEEAGYYRLVNDQALWTEQPDGDVFAPLHESPFDEKFKSEVGEVEGLEDLGDLLEAARRGCDPECGRGPRPEEG